MDAPGEQAQQTSTGLPADSERQHSVTADRQSNALLVISTCHYGEKDPCVYEVYSDNQKFGILRF